MNLVAYYLLCERESLPSNFQVRWFGKVGGGTGLMVFYDIFLIQVPVILGQKFSSIVSDVGEGITIPSLTVELGKGRKGVL